MELARYHNYTLPMVDPEDVETMDPRIIECYRKFDSKYQRGIVEVAWRKRRWKKNNPNDEVHIHMISDIIVSFWVLSILLFVDIGFWIVHNHMIYLTMYCRLKQSQAQKINRFIYPPSSKTFKLQVMFFIFYFSHTFITFCPSKIFFRSLLRLSFIK